ncbi:hypothetical protein [Conexibacter sp. SYSU D00693]|uniref:hypothetical protein n=1 Tax=Conexibacter sp. SYSU D00693 TaxID=2812560 RepID=UPI00196A4B17|nr:hypothetical protein [Conexibacter sp. SYSU D00693]
MPETLDPPITDEVLRERADELARELERHLAAQPEPSKDELERAARVTQRQAFFDAVRRAILAVARTPEWRAHDLARELLVLLEDFRDAIDDDPDATDPEWRQREALQRMLVVLRAMVRQLSHDAFDRPEEAARFVAQRLADVEVGEVARLLATTPRMVSTYRRGDVGQVRKNPNRITLVAQLVYELQWQMTPRGVLLWFDAPMPQLGGRTPRELLDEDPAAHRRALMALARGGRAQLDAAEPAAHGALDRAA